MRIERRRSHNVARPASGRHSLRRNRCDLGNREHLSAVSGRCSSRVREFSRGTGQGIALYDIPRVLDRKLCRRRAHVLRRTAIRIERVHHATGTMGGSGRRAAPAEAVRQVWDSRAFREPVSSCRPRSGTTFRRGDAPSAATRCTLCSGSIGNLVCDHNVRRIQGRVQLGSALRYDRSIGKDHRLFSFRARRAGGRISLREISPAKEVNR